MKHLFHVYWFIYNIDFKYEYEYMGMHTFINICIYIYIQTHLHFICPRSQVKYFLLNLRGKNGHWKNIFWMNISGGIAYFLKEFWNEVLCNCYIIIFRWNLHISISASSDIWLYLNYRAKQSILSKSLQILTLKQNISPCPISK